MQSVLHSSALSQRQEHQNVCWRCRWHVQISALRWRCLTGMLVYPQAHEKARLEAEAQEKADAAKGPPKALREPTEARYKPVQNA